MKKKTGGLFLFGSMLMMSLGGPVPCYALDGVYKDKLVIGRTCAVTGAGATHSTAVNTGSKLYIDRINREGGVHGRKLEILSYDDGYDPQNALTNVKKLITEDKVFCLFENYGSATGKATLPTLEASGVPLIAMMSNAEDVRLPMRRTIFTVTASSQFQFREIIKYAATKLGAKTFGVIYMDDSNGQGVKQAVSAALHELDMKPVFEKPVLRNFENMAEIMPSVLTAKPDVIIFGVQVKAAMNFMKSAAEGGFHPIYLGPATYLTNDFKASLKALEAGGAKAEHAKFYFSAVTPSISDAESSELVRSYLADAKAAGVKPEEAQIQGYLNALVLVEGLKRAGKDPTREGLRDALEAMGEVDFKGMKVSYSTKSHRGSTEVYIGAYKNGEFVPVK